MWFGLETYNEISVRITVNKIYIQVVLLYSLSMLNITKNTNKIKGFLMYFIHASFSFLAKNFDAVER